MFFKLTRRLLAYLWDFRMTLGHVYDMDLKKNETLIKEVIIQAQGEVRSRYCGVAAVY